MTEDTQTLRKYLRNAGGIVEIFSLFVALQGVAGLVMPFIDASIYQPAWFTAAAAQAIIGGVAVIFGGRIRKGNDAHTRGYLIALAVLFGALSVPPLLQGSMFSPSLLVFAGSLVGLYAFTKLNKFEEFRSGLIRPQYAIRGWRWAIVGVIGVLLLVVAVLFDVGGILETSQSAQRIP